LPTPPCCTPTARRLALAEEHRQTEAALRASGIPHVLLRNGWYVENYTAGLPAALQYKVVLGSAGTGRISSARRADYAMPRWPCSPPASP
jgi:NAD(P)H dehydrogenase (quinone)